ncbi:MAG: response regulator transcription factor [Alphaproteobacteria bacterium]|nr:response regulator transcription factor [Alphaproteobacteria bacterium]
MLFVEDDQDYREAFADALSNYGFSVVSFPDGAALLTSPNEVAAGDVIVLDWLLPDMSGIDLLSQLRQRGVTQPVVFLAAGGNVKYEIVAFAEGAREFIDKGRGLELVARRLKLVVETTTDRWRPGEGLVSGKLVLNPAVGRACWAGVDVDLTLSEYKIVELLVSNAGRYVRYRAIYDQMHYQGFRAGKGTRGYRVNVRSVIKRIRRKFCKIDPTFEQIQTFSAFGYRWRGSAAIPHSESVLD